MQSLFQAGKAQACRCRSCLTVVKTTVRKITTGPNTRKPTLSEVVTGCYTAAFGTFAVIDAKFKDIRRDDLDAQINDTKSAIAALKAENEMLSKKHSAKIQDMERVVTEEDAPWGSDREFVPDSSSREPAYLLWEEHGTKMFSAFMTSEYWKSIPVMKRTNYKRLRRWLEEDVTSESTKLQDFSESELSLREGEVSNFVRSILSSMDQSYTDSFEPSNLRTRIEALLSQDYPRFNNSPHYEARETHATLQEYLLKGIEASKTSTIENLCYNLLVSPVAPTGKTYNSLLLRLSEVGYHTIAEKLVLNARSHFRNYRFDYATAVCLLNHSKEANRTGLFYNYISNIFTSVATPDSTKSLLMSASDKGRQLFEVIIKGLLGLYKLKDAAEILCKSLQLGNVINSWSIVQLFGMCIYALDRAAAIMIIRTLASVPAYLDIFLSREVELQTILLHQIKYLLSISGLRDVPEDIQKDVFGRTGVDINGFKVLLNSIEFHDLRLQSEQIERATTRLYSALSSNLDTAELARESEAAMRDFNFHWTAASPQSWFGNNIMAESEHEPKFSHFTHEDFIDAQASLKAVVMSRIVTNNIRDTQALIKKTNEALQALEISTDVKGPELLTPYTPAHHASRRSIGLKGWERSSLPVNESIDADAQMKKKISLMESLRRSVPSQSTWSS